MNIKIEDVEKFINDKTRISVTTLYSTSGFNDFIYNNNMISYFHDVIFNTIDNQYKTISVVDLSLGNQNRFVDAQNDLIADSFYLLSELPDQLPVVYVMYCFCKRIENEYYKFTYEISELMAMLLYYGYSNSITPDELIRNVSWWDVMTDINYVNKFNKWPFKKIN